MFGLSYVYEEVVTVLVVTCTLGISLGFWDSQCHSTLHVMIFRLPHPPYWHLCSTGGVPKTSFSPCQPKTSVILTPDLSVPGSGKKTEGYRWIKTNERERERKVGGGQRRLISRKFTRGLSVKSGIQSDSKVKVLRGSLTVMGDTESWILGPSLFGWPGLVRYLLGRRFSSLVRPRSQCPSLVYPVYCISRHRHSFRQYQLMSRKLPPFLKMKEKILSECNGYSGLVFFLLFPFQSPVPGKVHVSITRTLLFLETQTSVSWTQV